MKDRGRQRGIGMAGFAEHLDEVVGAARASGSNDRDANRIAHGPRELAIESLAGTVAVHRGEQNLARTALLGFFGPLDRTRGPSGCVRRGQRPRKLPSAALGINRDDGRLRSKALRNLR